MIRARTWSPSACGACAKSSLLLPRSRPCAMLDTASQLLRFGSRAPNRIDAAWGVLAVACLGVMMASPTWETIPFHVIWITLTLLYGFRVWSLPTTAAILGAVMLATGASIFSDA